MELRVAVLVASLAQGLAACPKMDLRVAKSMATRGYDKVRISAITSPDTEKDCDFGDFFDYDEKFFGVEGNNMMTFRLRTQTQDVTPGSKCSVEVAGETLVLDTPKEGARVRGLFFADPCIRQQLPGPACPNGETMKVKERFSKAINELVGSDEFQFWGIVGDNFYDATGKIFLEFWEELSLEAKSKPFITVPGNHDFWNAGAPELGQPGGVDHFGYGWLQYFGQDVVASSLTNSTPYDTSVKPAKSIHDPPITGIPELENFVFWHQIGNVASFGFSGAHGTTLNPQTTHELLDPYIEQFCKWVGETDSVDMIMVHGHWNGPNLGCQPGMDAPKVYKVIMDKDGCSTKKGLYFEGHDHCNRVMENAAVQSTDPLPVGFMIGGSGMNGDCPPMSGFLVVDSMPDAEGGPNARVDYFSADDPTRWDALVSCWESNKGQGYTKCREAHATPWREVKEPASTANASIRVLSAAGDDIPKCGSPAPAPTPPPTPGPGPSPGGGAGNQNMTTIIAVGAVAGVALIGLAAFGFFFCKRRGAAAEGGAGLGDPLAGQNTQLSSGAAA